MVWMEQLSTCVLQVCLPIGWSSCIHFTFVELKLIQQARICNRTYFWVVYDLTHNFAVLYDTGRRW